MATLFQQVLYTQFQNSDRDKVRGVKLMLILQKNYFWPNENSTCEEHSALSQVGSQLVIIGRRGHNYLTSISQLYPDIQTSINIEPDERILKLKLELFKVRYAICHFMVRTGFNYLDTEQRF